MIALENNRLMPISWLCVLTFAAALGSGLMAGLFFAFSVFIMRALAGLPSVEGIRAMQAINVTVLNPIFLSVFSGTALAALVLAAAAVLRSSDASLWLLAGSAFYVGGCFLVTLVFNVPLNNRIAAVRAEEGADVWADYLRKWLPWNHVRTVGSLAACCAFILALLQLCGRTH